MANTTQDGFHPMRGHMFDGCKIACYNGDELELKSTLRGWQLKNRAGEIVCNNNDAQCIAVAVFSYKR